MKVYDELGMLLTAPDLEKGWLETQQRLVARHPEEPEIPAQTHIQIMEDTGGLDRVVIDVPAIPAVPAWDEYEMVQVYHPYTKDELEEENKPTIEERMTNAENAIMEIMLRGGAMNV